MKKTRRAQGGIVGAQRDKGLKKQVKMNKGVVNNWPPTSGARGGPNVTGKVFLKNLAEKASPGSVGSGIMSACIWQAAGDTCSSQQLLTRENTCHTYNGILTQRLFERHRE